MDFRASESLHLVELATLALTVCDGGDVWADSLPSLKRDGFLCGLQDGAAKGAPEGAGGGAVQSLGHESGAPRMRGFAGSSEAHPHPSAFSEIPAPCAEGKLTGASPAPAVSRCFSRARVSKALLSAFRMLT